MSRQDDFNGGSFIGLACDPQPSSKFQLKSSVDICQSGGRGTLTENFLYLLFRYACSVIVHLYIVSPLSFHTLILTVRLPLAHEAVPYGIFDNRLNAQYRDQDKGIFLQSHTQRSAYPET